MVTKVKDGLFLGDLESSQDPEFIELNKINRIINCASSQVSTSWTAPQIIPPPRSPLLPTSEAPPRTLKTLPWPPPLPGASMKQKEEEEEESRPLFRQAGGGSPAGPLRHPAQTPCSCTCGTSENSHIWFNYRDVAGILLSVVSCVLIIYAEYVVVWVVLADQTVWDTVNGALFSFLIVMCLACHLKVRPPGRWTQMIHRETSEADISHGSPPATSDPSSPHT